MATQTSRMAGQDVPYCLKWSSKDVAEWIESLGFPQYKVNYIFH